MVDSHDLIHVVLFEANFCNIFILQGASHCMCIAPLVLSMIINPSSKYKQAIDYALNRLQNELPAGLTYHNYWHTKEDVLPSCQRIAGLMGVDEADLALLEVGAAFHDIGFIEHNQDHELIGTKIAAQILPTFSYSEYEIELVTGMIMATRIPQSPHNLLEEILVDADLDLLGRPDFLARNMCLQQELVNFGHELQLKQWYEAQLAFLEQHTYFTPAAKKLRNTGKQQNIDIVKEKLRAQAKNLL